MHFAFILYSSMNVNILKMDHLYNHFIVKHDFFFLHLDFAHLLISDTVIQYIKKDGR